MQAFCAALVHDRSKEELFNNFEFNMQLFSKFVYEVLFLTNHREYFNVDGWPRTSSSTRTRR